MVLVEVLMMRYGVPVFVRVGPWFWWMLNLIVVVYMVDFVLLDDIKGL